MTDDREKTIRFAAAHFAHGDADSGEHHTMLCEVLADLDRLRAENAALRESLRWALGCYESDYPRYETWPGYQAARALLEGGEG